MFKGTLYKTTYQPGDDNCVKKGMEKFIAENRFSKKIKRLATNRTPLHRNNVKDVPN